MDTINTYIFIILFIYLFLKYVQLSYAPVAV